MADAERHVFHGLAAVNDQGLALAEANECARVITVHASRHRFCVAWLSASPGAAAIVPILEAFSGLRSFNALVQSMKVRIDASLSSENS